MKIGIGAVTKHAWLRFRERVCKDTGYGEFRDMLRNRPHRVIASSTRDHMIVRIDAGRVLSTGAHTFYGLVAPDGTLTTVMPSGWLTHDNHGRVVRLTEWGVERLPTDAALAPAGEPVVAKPGRNDNKRRWRERR